MDGTRRSLSNAPDQLTSARQVAGPSSQVALRRKWSCTLERLRGRAHSRENQAIACVKRPHSKGSAFSTLSRPSANAIAQAGRLLGHENAFHVPARRQTRGDAPELCREVGMDEEDLHGHGALCHRGRPLPSESRLVS
jgi:hypothetical protein